jgi:hypothetical protein
MNLLVQFAGGKDYLVGVYIFLGLGPWHNRYPSGTSPLGASSPMSFKLFPASRRYRDGMDSCRRARRRVDSGIVLFFATCRHRGRHCCRHLLPPSFAAIFAAIVGRCYRVRIHIFPRAGEACRAARRQAAVS